MSTQTVLSLSGVVIIKTRINGKLIREREREEREREREREREGGREHDRRREKIRRNNMFKLSVKPQQYVDMYVYYNGEILIVYAK